MIRFHCPKCGRECLLSSALIGVPLLCKGCGDRLAVPEVSEPLDEPPRPAFDRSLPEEGRHDILVTPTVEDSTVNLFVSTEMRKKLFMPIEGSGQPMPPAPPPEAERLPVAPASATSSSRTVLARLADAAVVVLLLALGAAVGSLAAGKPTSDILGDAPASPRFPPTDLLIWVASVAVCGLLYVWLFSRGWNLGARITRR
ncbi:MAG: hypothetical protein U0791_11350 [Gemmataceae bacterium]